MMKSYIPCLFDGMHRMALVLPRCLRGCCRHFIGAVHGEHPNYQKTPAKGAGKNRKRFILYLFLSFGVKITGPGVYSVVYFLSFTAPNVCILFRIQPDFNGAETFTTFQVGLLSRVYAVPTASLNT